MNTMFAIYLWLLQMLGLGVQPQLGGDHVVVPVDQTTASQTDGAQRGDRSADNQKLLISNGF